ncbi:MAG: DUF4136 domain-containing protein [Bacteroidia bacterium]
MKITFLKISIAAMLLSGVTIIGCQKETTVQTPTATLDSSKVTTQYNSSLDLSNYSTISVSDSVLEVSSTTDTAELTSTEASYVQTFKDSLAARGFTVVPLSSHPDLVLNISRISATSSGNIDSTAYWNNYATFYNPSLYGFTSATYSNSFTIYNQVNTGVLSFELLDLKNVSVLNQISIIWNGQVSGSSIYQDASLVKQVVDILLEKSPLRHSTP